MSNVLSKLFGDIAQAIRNKTGATNKIAPIDFPSQIDSITVRETDGSKSGWVTLIEETTITPTYDSDFGAYIVSIPIVDVRAFNLAPGTIYIVQIDGVSYPTGMTGIFTQITSGNLSGQYVNFLAAGDFTIRTGLFGQTFEYKISYNGNEPFMMMGGNDIPYSKATFMFTDSSSHKIKVDYMPRYGTIDTGDE